MDMQQALSSDNLASTPNEEETLQGQVPSPGDLDPDKPKVASVEDFNSVSQAAANTSVDDKLPQVLQDFANMRGRPVVYFLINDELLLGHAVLLWRALHNRMFDDLDVVIDSIGGDVHTAY